MEEDSFPPEIREKIVDERRKNFILSSVILLSLAVILVIYLLRVSSNPRYFILTLSIVFGLVSLMALDSIRRASHITGLEENYILVKRFKPDLVFLDKFSIIARKEDLYIVARGQKLYVLRLYNYVEADKGEIILSSTSSNEFSCTEFKGARIYHGKSDVIIPIGSGQYVKGNACVIILPSKDEIVYWEDDDFSQLLENVKNSLCK